MAHPKHKLLSGLATRTSENTGDHAPRILVFIPAYNCEKQISRVVAQFTPDIQQLVDCIAVIENRSTDGTLDAARRALAEALPSERYLLLRNCQNNGLGGSHKVAFNLALDHDFTHLIVLHGDDQGSIDDLVPFLRSGAFQEWDCLLGGRFMRGSRLQGYSMMRTVLNRGCNLLFSAITLRDVRDLGAGLNMYRVAAFQDRKYLNFVNSLSFNQVLLLYSIAARHKMRFFPLTWREDDQISNVRMARMGVQLARNVLSFTFARRKLLELDSAGVARLDYGSDWIAGDALQMAAHAKV